MNEIWDKSVKRVKNKLKRQGKGAKASHQQLKEDANFKSYNE